MNMQEKCYVCGVEVDVYIWTMQKTLSRPVCTFCRIAGVETAYIQAWQASIRAPQDVTTYHLLKAMAISHNTLFAQFIAQHDALQREIEMFRSQVADVRENMPGHDTDGGGYS